MNTIGQLVLLERVSPNQKSINTGKIAAGFYLIIIRNEKKKEFAVRQIIKE
jgi:hypothetical protein